MTADLLTNRERTLEQIYATVYPMMRHYIRQHGGTDDDAKDITQEALITYYEKTIHGQLSLTSSVSTYLMGIGKNLWRQELERRSRRTSLTDAVGNALPDDSEPETDLPAASLMTYVEQLGESCRSLLVSFYYFGQRLEQIARQHGYRSVRSATVQKHKCLERLRRSVSGLSIRHFNS